MDVTVSELLTKKVYGTHVQKAESIVSKINLFQNLGNGMIRTLEQYYHVQQSEGRKANSSSKTPFGACTNCQQPSNQPQNGHKIKELGWLLKQLIGLKLEAATVDDRHQHKTFLDVIAHLLMWRQKITSCH
ncbi:Uncharacterized protein Fot_55491 [Forsythia ovata]|uniref:Uncharacterized protein n=1 Tax=Forsythia ovata TaxID=205694 RepID=A0ABD1P4A3_9LAMI